MGSLQTVTLSSVIDVFESFSGWYWFVTEKHPHQLAFGLVRGFETEWGYFSLKELRALIKTGKVWKVPKRNWPVCPCVIDDTAEREGEQSPPAAQERAQKGERAA